MKRPILLLFLFSLLHLASFCQSQAGTDKEFRISSGFGIGSATTNVSSIGSNVWIQFDYELAKHFSIALDADFINYKQYGYIISLPVKPNVQKVYDNNVSFLVKYHFIPTKKIKINIGSGWTYCIRQTDYYNYFAVDSAQNWYSNVSSYSDYRIPFVAEFAYSLTHNLDICVRAKYNLNGQDGDSYSGGVGLSLKL
jgi:hypothetical protein